MVQPEEQAEEGLWLLSYQVGSRGCLQPAHVEKHICSVVDLWNEFSGSGYEFLEDPDLDPPHVIYAYLEIIKNLIINQKEESTN